MAPIMDTDPIKDTDSTIKDTDSIPASDSIVATPKGKGTNSNIKGTDSKINKGTGSISKGTDSNIKGTKSNINGMIMDLLDDDNIPSSQPRSSSSAEWPEGPMSFQKKLIMAVETDTAQELMSKDCRWVTIV